MTSEQMIERGRIELSQRIVRRVRKIHDRQIENVAVLSKPDKGIRINGPQLRRTQRVVIEMTKEFVLAEEVCHLRVQIHQSDRLHRWILQNFSERESVPPTENQNVPRRRQPLHRWMNERFVVAILILRAELKMAVEEESDIIFPSRQNETLVRSALRKYDFIRIQTFFGKCGQPFAIGKATHEKNQRCDTLSAKRGDSGNLVPKQARCPDCHENIKDAEHEACSNEAESRRED